MADDTPQPDAEIFIDQMGYPIDAERDELRRAWAVWVLCQTPSGPIFETLVSDAAAIAAFLSDGTAPQRSKLKVAK